MRHRFDGHHADVPLSAQGQQFLGGLPIAGKSPEGGVDREHDRVEVKASQGLQEDDRNVQIVAGDPGETCLAPLAELENSLQCPGPAVQLLQGGDGMSLVKIQHFRVEQSSGGVELVLYPVGVRPQGLARHEHFRPARGQMRSHHGLGLPVLGGDVQVVDAPVARQLEPRSGLGGSRRPTCRPPEDGHSALVARPAQPAPIHANAPTPATP